MDCRVCFTGIEFNSLYDPTERARIFGAIRVMIYIQSSGRLGNILFQYARARSFDQEVAFVASERDEGKFRQLARIVGALTFARDVPQNCLHYADPGEKKPLPITRPLAISGYFQYSEYLDEKLIKKLYRCPDEVRQKLERRYPQVFSPRVETVGVHVRRGDYMFIPHVLPFVGRGYLKTAIGRFSEKMTFVVCSDDMPWCRRFFMKCFPGRTFVFAEGNEALEDLYLLSFCNHNIISNSTFSWWSAYLNANPDKRIIVPARWHGFVKPKGVDMPSRKSGAYSQLEGSELVYSDPRELSYWLSLVLLYPIHRLGVWKFLLSLRNLCKRK